MRRRSKKFIKLVDEIRACDICRDHLPLGPRPVFQVHPNAKILIVGQAPGTAVHKTGIPFNDPSGDRLRLWLGVDKETFYDEKQLAIVPMGFCYPGKGQGGDLPPRPECAQTWRQTLLDQLPDIELTVVIGRYAIDWHLQTAKNTPLTELVRTSQSERIVVLPHPSPRNIRWFKNNPWLEDEVTPELRRKVANILTT